ncbi:MAG: Crp/Fnr family transcriptional regulator [Crocinitomicaceae bacterium]
MEISGLIQIIEKENIWDRELTLKRNEFLKLGGEKDLNIYFVEEGCLRLFVVDEEHEHIIRFGYQGNIVAALDSYISEQTSDLYIQAIRKTKVKVFSKSKFEKLINRSEKFKTIWLKVIEQLVFQQLEREIDILTASPLKRYKRVVSRSPQLFQEVPHKYIASYLRMTPETLSRLLKS